MITSDLNLLSMPRGRGIGDYNVQDPLNAWPGAGANVIIYMNRTENGSIAQTGYTEGDELNRWQRFRTASGAGVWTPWEPVTSAIPPDIYVELTGDQMTGPLLLPLAAPTQPSEATNKQYVDTAIASQPPTAPPPLYQGAWQVAANIPDLTLATVQNGFTWRAVTADPAVPEMAPVGIPGIGGQMVSQGDAVVWNAGNNVYDLIPNLSVTQPEADARYVQLSGAVPMIGPLMLAPGAPTQDSQAASKLYVDSAVANSGLYQGPWQVAANIPDLIAAAATALNGYTWIAVTTNPAVPEQAAAGIPGIGGTMIGNGDQVVWNAGTSVYDRLPGGGMTITEADARYLQLAGGVMAGTISLDDVHFITGVPTPVNNSHAANKAYADTKLAVVQVPGTPALSTLTFRGQYYPQVPYVPADAPAGAAGAWAMEVAASAAANIWQLFQSGPNAWSRNSMNGGTAWTPWLVLGAAGGTAFLPLAGGTMTGPIGMNNEAITGLPVPVGAQEAAPKSYVDTMLPLVGGTMSGGIDMDGNGIINLPAPVDGGAAANKDYVDTAVANAGLYKGLWQVATNVPDLITAAATAINGEFVRASTVDPLVPEQAAAGIPGIGGDMIANGDLVIWNDVLGIYEQQAAGGITIPEADARYLQLAGGAMAGPINMQGRPITQLFAPNAPGDAASKDYVDTAALLLVGGTLTGPLVLEPGAPQADNQAVPKSYVDAALNPLMWETVLTIPIGGGSSGGAGQTNYMYRDRFETAMFQASGGGKVRVTFAGASWTFEACIGYAAPQPGAGDASDFESTPTRLTFGGSNTGQFAATPANNLVVSDAVDFFVDPAKPLLVSIKVLAGGGTLASDDDVAGRHRGWYLPNGIVDQVDAPPMDAFATDTYGVARIEQGDNAAAYLPVAGGTMTGPIDMAGSKIANVPLPQANGDAASKAYVDNAGGLPIVVPANGTSFGTFRTSGLYICNYFGVDSPPNIAGCCIWVAKSGNQIWQNLDGFSSTTGAEYWRRYYNGAVWSAWVKETAFSQAELDQTYVRQDGGTMTGPLILPGVTPTDPAHAVIKEYVDDIIAQAVVGFVYQGTWQVATNVPDIAAIAKQGGWTWRAVTANPAVPEVCPPGIPGLSGQTISEGDTIIWNEVNLTFTLIHHLGLTQAEADARYLRLVGGSINGNLTMNGNLYMDSAVGNGLGRSIYWRNSTDENQAQIVANQQAVTNSTPEVQLEFYTNNGGYGWNMMFETQVASPRMVYFTGQISYTSAIDRSVPFSDEQPVPQTTMRDQLAALAAKVDELTTKLAALESAKPSP